MLPVICCAFLRTGLKKVSLVFKWKSVYSSYFNIDFGVRQGSILSPHLFAIYINDIANRFGINRRAFIVLYAADIFLVAPSLTELQSLFKISGIELAWLDICINMNKSCCMRIGNRFNSHCVAYISPQWNLECTH